MVDLACLARAVRLGRVYQPFQWTDYGLAVVQSADGTSGRAVPATVSAVAW
jgi:hypothetical protein